MFLVDRSGVQKFDVWQFDAALKSLRLRKSLQLRKSLLLRKSLQLQRSWQL